MTVLWRRIDQPGHDWCRLEEGRRQKILRGIALFTFNRRPCRIEYWVECDSLWQTKTATIEGEVGEATVKVGIGTDTKGHWFLSGNYIEGVDGCIDVDFGFSPSTNLLPIRRLGLDIGQQQMVAAAWLQFPSFTLQRLEQSYSRVAEDSYHYESAKGTFQKDLKVSAGGMVTVYPGYWEAESIE